MMLVYFGNVNLVNQAPTNSFILNHSIYKTSDPICLSFLQEDAASLSASSSQVIDLIHMLDALRKGVYMRVALYPNMSRLSTVQALIDAKGQVDAIYNIFLSYGLTDYLKGFALDNASLSNVYSDATQLERNDVNVLVDYVHNTYQIGVACFCNFGDDVVSLFTPPSPRASSGTDITLSPSRVGYNIPYEDWIIHTNPFSLTWQSSVVIQPDLSKVAAVLQMIKSLDYNQGIVQGMPFNGTYVFDNALNIVMDDASLQAIQNMSLFLETLGIYTYALCGDYAFGKTTNLHIDEGAYKPISSLNTAPGVLTAPNSLGIAYTYFYSDSSSVYIKANVNGTISTIASFSRALQPVSPIPSRQII